LNQALKDLKNIQRETGHEGHWFYAHSIRLLRFVTCFHRSISDTKHSIQLHSFHTTIYFS
jgi:hypothetical protein